MSNFCSDPTCSFYEDFPEGKKFKIKVCPYCEAPLINMHPNSVSEISDATQLEESNSLLKPGEFIFINNNAVDVPKARDSSAPVNPTNNVIVTFYTAILLTHLKAASSRISLRFRQSLPGDLSRDLDFNKFIVKTYQGSTYALLENSINIPISILDPGGRKNTLVVPYKYLLDGQEEMFYSDKGIVCRTLLLNCYNFSLPNIITQYDMIILPANLPTDQQRDFKTLWRVTFHLYSPVTEILRDNKLIISFSEIRSQVTHILISLCYAYMSCKTSKLLVTKTTYVHLFDSEENVNSFMRDLLLEWIDSIVDSDFPFHLKFYLSFLTVDKDVMLPCSSQIYFKLFKDIDANFILSKINDESEQLLKYQQDILKSPQLLHRALQEVSNTDIESLITFLPLYHRAFDSEHSFLQAHNEHDFLNISYWGLPLGISFTNSTNFEFPKIVNTLKQYNKLDPILPYSVALLCLRPDIFPQLLDTLEIPFLSFFALLLYRIDKWDLTVREEELRVTMYQTFLQRSHLVHDLMDNEQLCQAADVILTMIQVLKDSHDTKSIKLNEAILLLELLARLMVLYNRNEETASDRVTLDVIPPSDLLASIEQCVDEKIIFQPPKCNKHCVNELDIWNEFL